MIHPSASGGQTTVLTVLIAGCMACAPTLLMAGQDLPHKHSPYRPVKLTEHAVEYYKAAWGVDDLKVSQTASGNLIRFSYRVVEPKLAKTLGENQATPHLYGLRTRAMLDIPVMDKVGQLRQTNTVEVGKEYWMVFSNKGNIVKSGDRVNVMIGAFHADGLMVE